MAFGYMYVCIFTAVVAINLIFADESNSLLSREERSADEERAFLVAVPCNYSATPGRSCASCNETLKCLRNNVGFVRRCVSKPYCNGGRCSLVAPSSCNSTNVTVIVG